jgi:hypothetical protein
MGGQSKATGTLRHRMNGHRLVFVLSNPPETNGTRTLRRVELAREILSATEVRVVNLFSATTYRSGGISDAGIDEGPWRNARPALERALQKADIVVLAYGVKPPSGEARVHYKTQLAWLEHLLLTLAVPVYVFGDGPRHPSRWQRWTSRHHPGIPFPEAIRLSLSLRSDGR